MSLRSAVVVLLSVAWGAMVRPALADDDAFRSQVRPTEPLAPAEQQQRFHVPPGFEVQLFAAEPGIQKPMNMAFDGAGRLWVSGSIEYPYAAAGEGRDTIRVLEDTDGDGRADKITTFADGLNIPIGLYPYRDGVVAYSIPNIWFLRDTDGDGRADRREVLYGPLDTPRDTHGMQNAFRRGFDGWLYINHGFANETTIRGRDGSSIRLQSGNTYRVRLDGSRVEQFTWGQVNPFGSTFLPNGDLITADCHSRPLTLVLRGAYYPSFGKPHDGLGFAPDMMEHSHGSTAISGVAVCTGEHFPVEYQGRLFVGNVMTSRVNQDLVEYRGSTPRAVEQPDFLVTDDPWFRPVDLQFGPDGALYVADFYNRIIGHYEVPLDHPGRDRLRGRIWRIVYRGKEGEQRLPRLPDLSALDTSELIATLADPCLLRRMLALDQLTDRIGVSAAAPLADALARDPRPAVRIQALWGLHRLGALSRSQWDTARGDPEELVRIHALRVAAENSAWNLPLASLAIPSAGPMERRVAAEAAAQNPGHDVPRLLALLNETPPGDSLQRYAWRLAIRRQLRQPGAWTTVRSLDLTAEQESELASIAVAVPLTESAVFLLEYWRDRPWSPEQAESHLAHLCRHLPRERLSEVIRLVRQKANGDADLQLRLLPVVHQRVATRAGDLPELRAWGMELAEPLLSPDSGLANGWRSEATVNPWGLEPRSSDDGVQGTMFLSSLPGGERATATLRSREFTIPRRLSFYLCGHAGPPDQPAQAGSYVVLRLAEGDGEVARAEPPRSDTARRIEWELERYAGQAGYLELVDGLALPAYAWLAVARFEPAVVPMPAISLVRRGAYQTSACGLVEALRLDELKGAVTGVLHDRSADWTARSAAAKALLAFESRPLLAALAGVVPEPALDGRLRETILAAVTSTRADISAEKLVEVARSVPSRVHRALAESLASTPGGAEQVARLMEQGSVSPLLLKDPALREKLAATGPESLRKRWETLEASLPPLDLARLQLIEQRRKSFESAAVSVPRGQEIFRRQCAACHQVGGQGTLIAPQLDGIGNRGAERVIEDVLDPNRNVDAAFHLSVIVLANGQVTTGLLRREEDARLVLANQEGKEFSVPKVEIDEHRRVNASLMPANWGEVLKPDEFHDLVGYLLSLRVR